MDADKFSKGRLVCFLTAAQVKALHGRWGDVTVLEAIELEKWLQNWLDSSTWKASLS